MTREDIIDMAAQAGINEATWFYDDDVLEKFAALVAAAERERCIEVLLSNFDIEDENVFEVAAAIRSSGEK